MIHIKYDDIKLKENEKTRCAVYYLVI